MKLEFLNIGQIGRLKALTSLSRTIAVVCHTGPDGDAVGSSLAAGHVLSAMGKEVSVIVPDSFPDNIGTLPGAGTVIDAARNELLARRRIAAADLLLCLDFNTHSRAGVLGDAIAGREGATVLVDHHIGPEVKADPVISHPEMSSTAYLLFCVMCAAGWDEFISPDAAQCILAGMMTDTGNFSYNCDDPEIYCVIARLIEKGANKEKLNRALFNTFSVNCLRLNAYAIYHKLELLGDSGGALITLSRPELNRFHYKRGDTEGLVNRPLAIPGVRFSVFMRQETNYIRVSMRSIDTFPVSELCSRYFGGGGHLNAAGGEYYGTLQEAVDYFKSLLPAITAEFPMTSNES